MARNGFCSSTVEPAKLLEDHVAAKNGSWFHVVWMDGLENATLVRVEVNP